MRKVEICEYNPDAKRARYDNESVCGNPARWSVGAHGRWHLCNNCAALPEFARMRRRVPINRKDTP